MAVTASDQYAPGKKNRFVGICIERSHYGLASRFTLRNVVDGQGTIIKPVFKGHSDERTTCDQGMLSQHWVVSSPC